MNNRKVFLRLFLCLSFGWGTMTLNAQTVSKTFSNAPLKTVLKEVESQTGLSVVYKTDEVDVNRKVNASFQNASLEEVMAQILDNGLSWTVQDKMIVISKKAQELTKQVGKGLNVKGVIVDENGIPVIGASVLVRGSSNGTITDMDGNFLIADVPQDAMIDISYIGYKTLEFKATDKALANVVLKEDTEVLEEVRQRKRTCRVLLRRFHPRKSNTASVPIQVLPCKGLSRTSMYRSAMVRLIKKHRLTCVVKVLSMEVSRWC